MRELVNLLLLHYYFLLCLFDHYGVVLRQLVLLVELELPFRRRCQRGGERAFFLFIHLYIFLLLTSAVGIGATLACLTDVALVSELAIKADKVIDAAVLKSR